MADIVERLRSSSTGYKEWRVQNPADGAYCMSFCKRDSINPKRDAREWLEDHQRVYPESRFSQYVVACVDMLTDGDRLAMEAADEITRLRAQVAALEQMVCDAAYTLEGARIWGGMDWKYNPLHPFKYRPMLDRLNVERDKINDKRAAARKGDA